ncbi:MAG: OmpA family protein [Myxococcales bacterium]
MLGAATTRQESPHGANARFSNESGPDGRPRGAGHRLRPHPGNREDPRRRPRPAGSGGAGPAPATATAEAEDLQAIFAGEVIHFGLDSADLSQDDTARLQKIAEVLQRHPEVKIRISGNCDERGTEDYSLALGQRRAAKAKTYLRDLGIDGSRVETISYGKDQPVATGHDESAWTQNRRDEFGSR